jgi:hypothetical protein
LLFVGVDVIGDDKMNTKLDLNEDIYTFSIIWKASIQTVDNIERDNSG